ncbi:unnamed protein product [Adineta steineri]|uniref:Uncharacterized protein n=1 Tax=Adineta steineri TaxID=433720 RepID=A0A815J4T5_9BILA|nr:unnamed protein product [Adineta steineri]CAF1606219.1 unnamed protein product [Adineta steineri]
MYSLNSFVQLRLLSLNDMYSFNDKSFTFWNQLSSLKYLRTLKIKYGDSSEDDYAREEKEFIIHSIFNQDFCPLLTYFITRDDAMYRVGEEIPSLLKTTKTSNIKYLTIDHLCLTDLIKLLPALQNIRSFCIEEELTCDRKFYKQLEMPLMHGCNKLFLVLSDDITFEHIEYILKHTPNIKDLTFSISVDLLDAKKWEFLLSVYCPKLLKFVLSCNGPTDDYDFEEASNDFEEECKATTFWTVRGTTVTYGIYPGRHSFANIEVEFNIEKVSYSLLLTDFHIVVLQKSG